MIPIEDDKEFEVDPDGEQPENKNGQRGGRILHHGEIHAVVVASPGRTAEWTTRFLLDAAIVR
jgi:hypothetical protein